MAMKKQCPAPTEFIPRVIDLTGTNYEGRANRIEHVKQGDAVRLIREPDNPYDTNAINVFNDEGSLGHVAGIDSEILAPLLDDGTLEGVAYVAEVTPLSKMEKRKRKPKISICVYPKGMEIGGLEEVLSLLASQSKNTQGDGMPKNTAEQTVASEGKIDGTTMYFSPEAQTIRAAENLTWAKRSKIRQIKFSQGLTVIDDKTFMNLLQIESVELPSSTRKIGEYAFFGCEKLVSIKLPDGLREIGSNAFSITGLKSVDLPDSITSLGSGAFSCCEGLKEITFPSQLKEIESSMCSGSLLDEGETSLERITFRGNNLTTIGNEAFYGSGKLTTLELPDGLMTIERSAFQRCRSLQVVFIPNTVQRIGSLAFADNANLRYVQMPSVLKSSSEDSVSFSGTAFANCPNVVFLVAEDSYAKWYAERTGMQYIVKQFESLDEMVAGLGYTVLAKK